MKKALITGITGQDGSYLAEWLLAHDYEVHGMVRRSSTPNRERIKHLLERLTLHEADLLDQLSIVRLLELVEPDEVYNLGAQSFVGTSWQQPLLSAEMNALGVLRMLDAIRLVNPRVRYYQASTSEMFGQPSEEPQSELTPFRPRNPYGVAKLYGHWITVNYRDSYGLFACSGICFNHESPRRGREFVTRKVTEAVARIKCGLQRDMHLGNIEVERDWGFAGDFVRAMWLMLQKDSPDDYVIATGEKHSVMDFVQLAFGHVGLDWREHVQADPNLIRPAEVTNLRGDATKANQRLGWRPTVGFRDLVTMMVAADMAQIRASGRQS